MNDLKNKQLFLLDMDGTLYLGDSLFEGTADFLSWVRETNRKYLFLTNNSSKGVADYVRKMERLGIPAKPEDFLTSVQVTVQHLRERYQDRKIYVLGTQSFKQELTLGNLAVTECPGEDIGCVVIGFDTELTFSKLEIACRLLEKNVDYIATNPDLVCPTEFGYVPDCGSMAQILCNATGRLPCFLGKPDPRIVEMAIAVSSYEPSQALVIGDRLHTDIACGARAGVDTALVLSGEATRADVDESEYQPTWVFENIKECYNALK